MWRRPFQPFRATLWVGLEMSAPKQKKLCVSKMPSCGSPSLQTRELTHVAPGLPEGLGDKVSLGEIPGPLELQRAWEVATLEGVVSGVWGVTVGMAWAVSRVLEDRKETVRRHEDCSVRTQSPLLCLPVATPFCWLSLFPHIFSSLRFVIFQMTPK